MLEIPRRISLTAQIAAAIRKGIADGVWQDSLPGERRLCETFQASRPTVRAALRALADEGWFEIRQGHRSVLRDHPRSRGAGNRTIAIIVHEPFAQLGTILNQGLSEMRLQLAQQGFTSEIHVCPTRVGRAQTFRLQTFVHQHQPLCCVLVSTSLAVQRWFCDRDIPAVVLGSCHPSVRLPSLDVDYPAACRHAVGIFLRKGHRRLALLVPDSGNAGDLATEQSFRAAVAHAGGPGARASVVRHNGTAASIGAKLDALFSVAERPTGLLIARTPYVFMALLHLMKRGLLVPGAVSVIARDPDPLFEKIDPPLAHYAFRTDAYIRQLCRLMQQMVSERREARPQLIVPTFVAGRSVQAIGPQVSGAA